MVSDGIARSVYQWPRQVGECRRFLKLASYCLLSSKDALGARARGGLTRMDCCQTGAAREGV